MATDTTVSQTDNSLLSIVSNGLSGAVNSASNLVAPSSTGFTAYNDPLLQGLQGNSSFVPTNQNYVVRLVQNGTGYSIIGKTPEDFEFSVTNSYTPMMAKLSDALGYSPSGGSASKIVDYGIAGALAAGYAPLATSIQMWEGTSPLEFNLPLVFRAYRDPRSEVINPAKTLVQMGSPRKGGTGVGSAFLYSPGPTPVDVAAATAAAIGGGSFLKSINRGITMYFGTGIVVPGLIITSLSIKMPNRIDRASGLPTVCEAQVGLRSVVDYSQDDILAMFYGTGFGATTG